MRESKTREAPTSRFRPRSLMAAARYRLGHATGVQTPPASREFPAPAGAGNPKSAPLPFMKPVTLALASAGDLHRVPWLLPNARYYTCEVVVLDDRPDEADLDACAFLNGHGVIVRFIPAYWTDANVGLDTMVNGAAGELIVALDSYRSEDASDVADLLIGDLKGAAYMKDMLILGESDARSAGNGRWEAAMASRYSRANGTPIRDFGVGSFVLRTSAVGDVLRVRRPLTGPGSPMGREALASLSVAASLARLTIHEAPVYAYERATKPIAVEFLDQIAATTGRTPKPMPDWHQPLTETAERDRVSDRLQR